MHQGGSPSVSRKARKLSQNLDRPNSTSLRRAQSEKREPIKASRRNRAETASLQRVYRLKLGIVLYFEGSALNLVVPDRPLRAYSWLTPWVQKKCVLLEIAASELNIISESVIQIDSLSLSYLSSFCLGRIFLCLVLFIFRLGQPLFLIR